MRTAAGLFVASVLYLLPGLAVTAALLPQLGRARQLAVAPLVSVGLAYVFGQAATLAGQPVDWRLSAGIVLGSLLLAWAVRLRASGAASHDRLPRVVTVSTVAGSALCAAFWTASVGGASAVPTHDDGYNHGTMVARILEVRSLAPADLFLPGPVDVPVPAFYPMALHQQAAVVVQVTGVDVGLALSLSALVPIVVSLPLGVALLTRRLLPQHVAVAAAAPLLVAVQPVLMYSMSWWGGLTMAVGLGLLPGFLDAYLSLTERFRGLPSVVAAVGIAGLAGLHTSEVPLLAVLATTLALGSVAGRRRLRPMAQRTAALAAPFVMALVLLLPVLAQMAVVYRQTTTNAPGHVGAVPVLEALGRVLLLQVGHPPLATTTMALAAWLGLILVTRQGGRAALTWVLMCLVTAALSFWLWAWPGPVINTLTSFFYASAPRMTYVLVLLLLPMLAAGLVLPVQAWSRSWRASPARPPGLATTTFAAIAVVLVGDMAANTSAATVQGVRENYREYSTVGRDERAAFEFLAEHVREGEYVLNQLQDGSPWMYALEGVQPVLPMKGDGYDSPRYADMRSLLADAGEADSDPRIAQMLRDNRVRYVYMSERTFPGRPSELRLRELRDSKAYREVFRSGRAHVFAVDANELAGP